MRKKIKPEEKRSIIIGVKVKPETKKQLEFIASREGDTLSTWINKKLSEEIKKYFEYAKLNWEEYK